MLVFLDESGDTGWKPTSQKHFVVSLIVFSSHDEAGACDSEISELRKSLSKSDDFEFHFSSNSDKIKLEFLKTVAPFNFSILTVAIHKDPNGIIATTYKQKNTFYRYACHSVLVNALPYLDKATVVMDKGKSHNFYSDFRKYIRTEFDDKSKDIIRKIKPQDSKDNNLLQVVDYCAGIYARRFTNGKNWRDYYKYISPKELSYQELPK
jgi:hypothetical protein